METIKTYDIAIIGAGPAGCCAALALQKANCSVVIFEKEEFPRSKTCGDGLCDRSINALKDLSIEYYNEFTSTLPHIEITNTKLFYKNRPYQIDFKDFGYTCKRIDFDNFLFSLVQRDCNNCEILQKTPIQSLERQNDGIVLSSKDGNQFFAHLVIICNGASSKLARSITNEKYDKEKMGVAVRAYYSNVQGLEKSIELHYKKEYFPGYFWIFPLSNGLANVGFGCHLSKNAPKQKDYKSILEDWIANEPNIRDRFAQAQQQTPVLGGLIPYNTTNFNICGENYCICGDAANLIDPISGGGIGSSMVSGIYAAQIAKKCVNKKDYSKNATQEYVTLLKNRVGKEMQMRYGIQKQFTKHTWLLDVFAFFARRKWILNSIQKHYL